MDVFEVWKPIIGYEGLYEISNFGRVKSLVRPIGNRYKKAIRTVHREKILTPCKKDNAYFYISLTKKRNQEQQIYP